MLQSFSFFKRFPGGENEGGGTSENAIPKPADTASTELPKEGEKGFIDKVKDALQDWSSEDQAQQDLDDILPVT